MFHRGLLHGLGPTNQAVVDDPYVVHFVTRSRFTDRSILGVTAVLMSRVSGLPAVDPQTLFAVIWLALTYGAACFLIVGFVECVWGLSIIYSRRCLSLHRTRLPPFVSMEEDFVPEALMEIVDYHLDALHVRVRGEEAGPVSEARYKAGGVKVVVG